MCINICIHLQKPLTFSLSLSVAKNAFIDIYLHLYYIYIYTNKYALYIRLYRLSHLYSAYAAIMDVIDVPSSWQGITGISFPILHLKQVTEEAVFHSIDEAIAAEDLSWQKESWNQNAVPKGAVLQPLYALMSDFLDLEDIQDVRGKLQKPLELKIQVIFGEVVGACLNTHPMYLWVTRDGTVILWNPTMPGLLKKGHGFWENLPDVIFQLLLRCLRKSWSWMRQISEELAKNLDELRVDWLLGDDTWGCRIGEVTYMGTMALDVFPISWRLAKTFAAGHLSRRRLELVEPF